MGDDIEVYFHVVNIPDVLIFSLLLRLILYAIKQN